MDDLKGYSDSYKGAEKMVEVLRELKKSFQFYIVDFIIFTNGKIKKYMTVGKRISGSFKCAQPEVASFIRLGVVWSQSKKNGKSDFAVDEEKVADRIGITGFWPDVYQFSSMKT